MQKTTIQNQLPRHTTSAIPSIVLAVLAGAALSVQASNLVVNGDFTANAAAYVTSPGWNGYMAAGAGNPTRIANWVNSPGNGSVALNGPLTGFGPASPFTPGVTPNFNFACLQWATQTIYQNLALTTNATYQVDFDAAAPAWQTGGKFMVQLCDDVTPFWYSGSTDATNTEFVHYTFTCTTPPRFVGTPNIRLVVSAATGAAGDMVLFGNVSVQPSAIAAASPNLVTNGDFYVTAPEFIAWPGYVNVPAVASSNPENIAEWNWNHAGLCGLNGIYTGLIPTSSPFGPSTPLSCFAFMQWAPGNTLSQDLALEPNTKYQLEFDAAGQAGVADGMFTVKMRDGFTSFWDTGSLPCNNKEFVHYTYTFTTPATLEANPNILLLNSGSGNVSADFAHVSVRLAPATPVTLQVARAGANLLLTWSSGTLLEANAVTGSWTPVSGATSPYLVAPTDAKRFYRVQVQ